MPILKRSLTALGLVAAPAIAIAETAAAPPQTGPAALEATYLSLRVAHGPAEKRMAQAYVRLAQAPNGHGRLPETECHTRQELGL